MRCQSKQKKNKIKTEKTIMSKKVMSTSMKVKRTVNVRLFSRVDPHIELHEYEDVRPFSSKINEILSIHQFH